MTVLDMDGRIQHLNRANEALLGRSSVELRGRSINELLPPDLQRQSAALLASVRETGHLHGIYPTVHADGSHTFVEATIEVVRSSAGAQRWIVASIHDLGPELRQIERLSQSAWGLVADDALDLLVTTIKEARQLLGARYAALGVVEEGRPVRFIPDGLSEAQIAAIDHWPEGLGLLGEMITGRTTIRLPDLAAHPRSTGFPRGHPAMRSFLGTPIQLDGEVFGHLYLTDKLDALEFSIVDERTAEVFAAHAAIAIRDQRRRHALEATVETLRHKEADLGRQATILAHVRDSIIVTDMAGQIIYWNPGAEAIFGYGADEMIGRTPAMLYQDQDMSSLQADLGRIVAGEDYVGEWLGRKKDGTPVWIDIRTTLMRNPTGDPIGFIGVGHDITARKLAEGERASAEVALQRSERSLAEAQRIAHLGSWERDIATGALWWSDESHRIFGLEPGTFSGTVDDFVAFVHPDDRSRAAPTPADLATGDPQTVEYRIIRADGAVRTLHEEAVVIRDASGAPIRYVGTTQDITERVTAEARQVRLATLLDEVTSEIYVFDAQTLHFSEANAAALRNLGYSLDELRELTPLDIKPAYTPATFAELLAPLRDGKREQIAFSTVHRRKDGSTYPVEVRLDFAAAETPAVFVAVIQDISERIAAEEERARLASAVEHTADSIIIYDRDLTVAYVNPSFSRLYGFAAGQILGKRGNVLASGRHDDDFWADLWATVRAGRPWAGSIVNRRKDGVLVEVESVISPVHDAAGQITNYVQTDRDVTHERELEGALERDARERETIEAALERIDPTASVEEIAAAACAEIARLPGVDSGWALGFVRGRGQVLAVEGEIAPILRAGQMIPDVRARHIMERAAQGPWTETWEQRPEYGAYGERASSAGLRGLAFAPLRGSHGILGVLALGTTESVDEGRLLERLPALATFGSIVGALLAPGLEARHRVAEARADIQSIIDAGAFAPFFQPIVDLHKGRVAGYEALSRFADGQRPDLVFGLAREIGLGIELEMATLRAAVAASAVLPPDAYLSLNTSPELIVSGELAALLGGNQRPMVLEITEHVVIDDYIVLRQNLKALGGSVRLAVDDAGAGYASLRHILELKPDFVKLDMALVRRINRDPARQALIAGIGYFALKRKVHLIAEGIETAAEQRALKVLGVSHGQGYLLGRPRDGRSPGAWPTSVTLPA